MVVPRFADLLGAPEAPAIVAVDIPIGLPERTGYGGRAAENAMRPLLGMRQSSVFSVPSRAAIETDDYAEACKVALADLRAAAQGFETAFHDRAEDPRGRSLPARRAAHWRARVFEVHPELAFWRLNGGRGIERAEKGERPLYEPGLAAAPAIC